MSIKINLSLFKLVAFIGLAAVLSQGNTAFAQNNTGKGKMLYETKASSTGSFCQTCHLPNISTNQSNIKNGANNGKLIGSAITGNTGGMNVFVGKFNAQDLDDMGAYIASYPTVTNVARALLSTATLPAFASTITGQTSATQTVTLTNNGSAGMTITSVVLSGANASEFSLSHNCGATLAVDAVCTATVAFKPTTSGAKSAAIDFNNDTGKSSVAVSGTAVVGAAAASIAPASLSFGTTIQGSSSAVLTSTVTNTGNANLVFSGYSVTGTNAADFSLGTAAGSCNATISLAPNAKCTVDVTFKPSTAAAESAAVSITHNGTGGTSSIGLTGTGGAALPLLTATATTLSFGSITVGTTATAQKFDLKNTGQAPLTFSGFVWSGTTPGDFSQTNTCPVSPATLGVGISCTVTVSFTPTAAGARGPATLTVNSNSSGTAPVITASGIATATAVASITATPNPVAFTATTVNTTATAKTLAITNNGQAPLSITGISLAGTNAAEFTQTSACAGTSVAVNGSCTVTIGFKPTSVGTGKTATLTVASNASNNVNFPVSITGDSVATPVASITSDVSSLTFAATTLNMSAATQKVTITNSATANAAGQSASLNISGVAVTGTNASEFTQTNNCPAALAATASCVVTVTFKPTATGIRNASVTITSDASNSKAYGVALSGTGSAVPMPAITVSATTLDFGNQLVSAASGAQTVTVTNSGSADLSVTSATSSDPTFTVSNGCAAAVAPAGTCAISVTFTPTATGAKTASLTISATGITGANVNLTGAGVTATTPGADAINGQKLYLANCASCHSANPAANVSKVANGVIAGSILKAIKAGNNGMNTPNLVALSIQELNDISAYIGAQTGQPSSPIPTGTTTTPVPAGSGTNVGRGGCTIGTTDSPFDPLLILMAVVSLVVLARRQTRR